MLVRRVSALPRAVRGIARNGALAYLVDGSADAVFEVELTTARTRLISSENRGAGDGFTNPVGVDYTPLSGRILVVDSRLDALVSVYPATGDRAILSDDDTGTGDVFDSPDDVEAAGGFAYVSDTGLDAIFEVTLATGDRRIISDASTGSGTAFERPEGIAHDADNELLYVIDWTLEEVFSVDLLAGGTFGDREQVSDCAGSLSQPSGVAISADGTRLAINTQAGTEAVWSVDLSTGECAVISDGGNLTQGPYMQRPVDIEFGAGDVLIAGDAFLGTIFRIVTTDGSRTIRTDGFVGSGANFPHIAGLAVSPDATTAWIGDSWEDFLVPVDLADGSRGAPLASGDDAEGLAFESPARIELDAANDLLYYLDSVREYVGVIDLVGGGRTEVSSNSLGTGESFVVTFDFGLVDTDTALVLDLSLDALFEVDLTNGNRTLLSDATRGSGDPFVGVNRFEIDAGSNRALVVDRDPDPIIAVTLTDGARTTVSSNSVGTGESFLQLDEAAWAPELGVLFVVDDSFSSPKLFAVEVASGDREVVASSDIGSGPVALNRIEEMRWEPNTGTLLLTDEPNSALILLDVVSGDRLVLAR